MGKLYSYYWMSLSIKSEQHFKIISVFNKLCGLLQIRPQPLPLKAFYIVSCPVTVSVRLWLNCGPQDVLHCFAFDRQWIELFMQYSSRVKQTGIILNILEKQCDDDDRIR